LERSLESSMPATALGMMKIERDRSGFSVSHGTEVAVGSEADAHWCY
jgi:hypothetical protein